MPTWLVSAVTPAESLLALPQLVSPAMPTRLTMQEYLGLIVPRVITPVTGLLPIMGRIRALQMKAALV